MLPRGLFYLTFVGLYTLIWLPMFLLRKDARREMLTIGWIFGIAGVLSEFTYIQDWWRPTTITGTKIGLEDFLIGFFIGGVVAVVYEECFGKHLIKKREGSLRYKWLLMIYFGLVFFGSYMLFHIHSFYASLIAFWLFIFYMMLKRSDLAADSLMSGLLALCIGAIVYWSLNLLYPGFIERYWLLPHVWFSTMFLGIPVAEYVWYFSAGAFIGPLYEFVENKRFQNTPRKKIIRA